MKFILVFAKFSQNIQKFTNQSKVRHNVHNHDTMVVWLVECSAAHHLRSWIDGEAQLGLLAVLHREALHEQGCEPRPGPATEGVEHQEPLCFSGFGKRKIQEKFILRNFITVCIINISVMVGTLLFLKFLK